MKHASAATLTKYPALLAPLRNSTALTERTPGSFYRKSSAFLHFHEDPAGLFADVKLNGKDFERFRVSTKAEQVLFLKAVNVALAVK